MRGLFTNRTLSLPAGQAVSGTAAHADTLRIQRGRVWITVEGISHDYFLHAGDSFTAVPGRLTVLEADGDASVELRRPEAGRILKGIGQQLAAFLQGMSRRAVVQTSLKRHRTCDAC
ncbi:DUF2917 domain-containing protein [Noviherbaspirillum denitrificans]|uniref:DUF2917 domain-containing protein n=1 Tax=Noviherbaspirillum denitrificans TaxID=1968433 RepID=A0A254TA26_9BURK|nr:DUF2917 domain-containing protein [Noviherbaspirillum denitrificans]OWW19425.1 hypothetical protein AYR66_07790 [Noviherbaspirillum denitrificans]